MSNPELLEKVETLKSEGYKTPDWVYCLAIGTILRGGHFESYLALDALMAEDQKPIVDLLSKRTVSGIGDVAIIYRGPVSRVKYQVIRGKKHVSTLPDSIEVTVVSNNFETSRAKGKNYAGWWATFD